MKSDLLFHQGQEKQAEPLPTQDLIPSKSLSTPEMEQPKPTPSVEAIPAARVEKKSSTWKVARIVLAILAIFILFLSFASVGYWGYTLNNELATAQQQLTVLQAEHEKLQTDYAVITSEKEELNVELSQSTTDLDKASSDLEDARASLKSSEAQNSELHAQIDSASALAEILYAVATSEDDTDILKIDRLVNAAGNRELTKHWETFAESPSEDAFNTFFTYLLFATHESLSQIPPQAQIGAKPYFLDDVALALK
ncbi:MAG: hypothetical protein M3Y68_07800 [Chloroflexota bacterium]|nr:hypothetical protein [Chloroflexota bacterium]